jgi:hypothetical protein
MEKKKTGRENGMTLIEVLLAGSIGALLLSALTISMGFFLEFSREGLDEQGLVMNHHMAMKKNLSTISRALDVNVESSGTISMNLPGGETRSLSWTGVPADPMTLSIDGGAPIPFVDGIDALTFSTEMLSYMEEEQIVDNRELLAFDLHAGTTTEWEDYTLAANARYGLTFKVVYTCEVENIELTCIVVRIGKMASHQGNLVITLVEGHDESRPRPWGDALATHLVQNSSIPLVRDVGGVLEIDWMTITLPEGFTIQPNRFFCLLFESDGVHEAGMLRVNHITGGTGPIDGMAFLGTDDGGATWQPPLKTQEYRQRDVPIHLDGDVTFIRRWPAQRIDSVVVTLGMKSGRSTFLGVGKAKVRGGGEQNGF